MVWTVQNRNCIAYNGRFALSIRQWDWQLVQNYSEYLCLFFQWKNNWGVKTTFFNYLVMLTLLSDISLTIMNLWDYRVEKYFIKHGTFTNSYEDTKALLIFKKSRSIGRVPEVLIFVLWKKYFKKQPRSHIYEFPSYTPGSTWIGLGVPWLV